MNDWFWILKLVGYGLGVTPGSSSGCEHALVAACDVIRSGVLRLMVVDMIRGCFFATLWQSQKIFSTSMFI